MDFLCFSHTQSQIQVSLLAVEVGFTFETFLMINLVQITFLMIFCLPYTALGGSMQHNFTINLAF